MTFLITLFLISLSALFSGLSLGLMGLGPHELKRKMSLGDKNAGKIYHVRKRGNLLLVTLLLSNVAVNSALSIFLGSVATGVMAGIIATALITVFGEIAPQAVFSRYAMILGAKTAWLVKIIIFVLYPFCAPLAWILDKIFGEELPTVFSKKELVQILEEHKDSGESDVKSDEERIARGALTFGEKSIGEVMTPRSMIEGIEKNEKLDQKTIKKLIADGYSRFPVYEKSIDNIVGILYAYDILSQGSIGKKASELMDKVYFLNEIENLDHALNAFIKTKHHLFAVVNKFSETVGIVSIEDILEEIIGQEIVDEFDKYDNVREVAEKRKKTSDVL